MPKTNKHNTILLFSLFATMLFIGIIDNIRGPALPRIQMDFDVSAFQLGLVPAFSAVGYLAASAFTAALGRKIGMKSCLMLAFALVLLTGVFMAFTPGFTPMLIGFVTLNIGAGMLDVSVNIIAGSTFTENVGSKMNKIHLFYGLGGIFAPIISTSIMMARFGESLSGWRLMYLVVLSWAIVPAALAVFSKIKKLTITKKPDSYAKLLKMPKLRLLVATLTIGLIVESGVAVWLVIYLERALDFAPDRAALFLTLYFICFTASRLLMGPLIDKIGIVNSLVILMTFGGVLIVSGVLLGAPGAPLIVASGIGIAPLFPTVMAAISKLFYEEVDRAMTAVITSMGVLMIPANLLVGAIIQSSRHFLDPIFGQEAMRLAYSTGFMFVGVASFLAAATAFVLRRILKSEGRLC